jgi:hypothetical protein
MIVRECQRWLGLERHGKQPEGMSAAVSDSVRESSSVADASVRTRLLNGLDETSVDTATQLGACIDLTGWLAALDDFRHWLIREAA